MTIGWQRMIQDSWRPIRALVIQSRSVLWQGDVLTRRDSLQIWYCQIRRGRLEVENCLQGDRVSRDSPKIYDVSMSQESQSGRTDRYR
jgi:hypothetical protein